MSRQQEKSKALTLKAGKIWRASLLLFTANILGGVANYFFQLSAARNLSVAAFGSLNSWLATFSVYAIAGSICQILANFFPASAQRLRLGAFLLVIICLGVMSFVFGNLDNKNLTTGTVLFVSILASMGVSWLVGQLQFRLCFPLIGGAGLLGTLGKLALVLMPLPKEIQGNAYYLATLFGASLYGLLLAVGTYLFPQDIATDHQGHQGHHDQLYPRFSSAVILAIANALIPQMDIINLRYFQADDLIGQYSRASLFAKAIIFGASMVLQVALPLQIKAMKTDVPQIVRPSWRNPYLILVVFCLLATVISTQIGPLVATYLFGFDLSEYRSWIFLTALIASTQFGLLMAIQKEATALHWQSAATVLAAAGSILVLNQLARPFAVDSYLVLAAIIYASILGIYSAWHFWRRDAR